MVRMLRTDTYEGRGYTDENSLAKLGVTQPDWISRKTTYIHGKDKAMKFSFLSMTEGQGNVKYETNDVEYKWPVIGRMKHTVEVVELYGTEWGTPPANVGIGNTTFQVVMTDEWGIRDYGLLTPTKTQVHIMEKPRRLGVNRWLYTLQLRSGNPADVMDLGDLEAGTHWVMLAPKVPESGSRGNESRSMSGGSMINQVSFDRYTKIIEGNTANKVAVYEFSGSDTTDGSKVNLWISEEQRQHDIWVKTMKNTDLYTQEYNRVNGEIALRYEANGKPIPIGAGVRQTIMDMGQYISFGETLPLALIDGVVNSTMYDNDTEYGVELIVHGGSGFGKLLDNAIKTDATNSSFQQALGDKMISGSNGKLSYGAYFNQYKTVDGHTITYVHEPMFDRGGLLAELDIANGNMTSDNKPRSTYTGVVMDYSIRGGARNVELVAMKGQSWIAGVVKGLAPIPSEWGVVPTNNFAHDKDESSYEVKCSSGINIKDAEGCILFESVQ